MKFILAGLGLAVCMAGPAARAAVYDAVTQSATGTLVTVDGIVNDGRGFKGFPLELVFTAAGVASGEVSGFESAGDVPADTLVSGLDGFVSLATFQDGATVGNLYDSLSLDVVFGAGGAITSDYIQFSDADVAFTIVNGQASFGSDGPLNCAASQDSGACAAVVRFVQVPEPASLALIFGAVGMMAAVRRRA